MNARPSIHLHWENRGTKPAARTASLVPKLSSGAKLSLVQGDNLDGLEALRADFAGAVALVYMDPPFFTGREHQLVKRRKGLDGRPERTLSRGFDDRWNSLEEYLETLWPRLVAATKLLRPDGCLVLHVDSKTSHYAKILLDELLGPECFASEIVWRYRRWPAKTRNFQRVHDVLLRYVREPSRTPIFNQLYEPLAASTRATWGSGKQRAVFDSKGRRLRSTTMSDASPGTPMGDVWEIGIVAPVAKERTGYPTQKPEALLDRLISACTCPGDLVLDPYLGSGTTVAVAAMLNRRAIGIDVNPASIELTRERLARLGETWIETSALGGDELANLRKAAPAVRERVA